VRSGRIIHGDCLEVMQGMTADSVDLVFGSPPYEAARTYGIDFALKGQDWVDWMVDRMVEMARVSKGLVAMVVEGQTRQFRWSAAPVLLMADLHRKGLHLRKPPAFHRVGIPGSGGPDWLRNDYEFIVCCTKGGKLPWSDNTAMGVKPVWQVDGAMSNRTTDGQRRNAKTGQRLKDGRYNRRIAGEKDIQTRRKQNGERVMDGLYAEPTIANPGNVIACIVGGGVMGDRLCHENEAPFPESLAEFFVRSFCPEGGTVLDPFSGSGTTAAVAVRWGRKYIAIDIRESQIALTKRRLANAEKPLLAGV